LDPIYIYGTGTDRKNFTVDGCGNKSPAGSVLSSASYAIEEVIMVSVSKRILSLAAVTLAVIGVALTAPSAQAGVRVGFGFGFPVGYGGFYGAPYPYPYAYPYAGYPGYYPGYYPAYYYGAPGFYGPGFFGIGFGGRFGGRGFGGRGGGFGHGGGHR
jgi:hypothetical protein